MTLESRIVAVVQAIGADVKMLRERTHVTKHWYVGPLVPTVGNGRWYPERSVSLTQAYFSIGESSTGSVVIDVKKNGVSLFSGAKPTAMPNTYKSSVIPLAVTLTPSDYLTVDIQSALNGANLTAVIVYI